MGNWYILESKSDYNRALRRIDALIDQKSSKSRDQELALISLLVEHYEKENFTMPEASPIEVIQFIMEMKGLQQKDFVPFIGSRSNISRLLSGKRKLTLPWILKLSEFLNIPPGSLIPNISEAKLEQKRA